MAWLRRLVLPLRRVWNFSIGRLRGQRRGRGGFAKLYYHVQSCGYEDVHVMWSMLQKAGQHPPTLQSCKGAPGAFSARS